MLGQLLKQLCTFFNAVMLGITVTSSYEKNNCVNNRLLDGYGTVMAQLWHSYGQGYAIPVVFPKKTEIGIA